jgi:hypothetical protein
MPPSMMFDGLSVTEAMIPDEHPVGLAVVTGTALPFAQ